MRKEKTPQEMGGYTIYQAAEILGVNHTTIRRWIKSGKLGANKYTDRTIRIPASAIKNMGASHGS